MADTLPSSGTAIEEKIDRRKFNKGVTKYDAEKTPARLRALIVEMNQLKPGKAGFKKFMQRYCVVEHVCSWLGISKQGLYDWRGAHTEFEEAYGEWENKRNMLFTSYCEQFPSPAVWIFLAKNWLKYSDSQISQIKADITRRNYGTGKRSSIDDMSDAELERLIAGSHEKRSEHMDGE